MKKQIYMIICMGVITLINKITLDDFKAFEHAEIEIKPITILIGPNNGGKTSILQAIRLIQQTLRGSGLDVLNLRDPLNLDDFDTVIHQNSEEKAIRFKFDFDEEKYFDIKIAKEKGELFVKKFSCNNGEFEYILEDILEKRDTDKEKSKYYEFKKVRFYPEDYENLIKLGKVKPVFFRDTFFFRIRPAIEDIILESDIIKRLIDSSSKVEGKDAKVEEKDAKVRLIEYLQRLYTFERISNDFYQNIKQQFENIKYIGPIRATAIRSYDKGAYNDVGVMGEHAVQILANEQNIRSDVENYFINMDIADSIEVSKGEKRLEFKLKTKITEKGVNFADVGCGTAQVLPIIVQSLIKQKESLILIEQPEIHLHPKVQADLADFFIKVSSKDRRFLLETHSDYFIERIRYGIMNGTIPTENVAIYYIEQDGAKKSSAATEIKINSKGQYSNLPDSFVTNFRLEETRKMTMKLLENLKEQ